MTRRIKTLRVGCGSSAPACKIPLALQLAESGVVEYLAFDRLAEIVTAEQQLNKWRARNSMHSEPGRDRNGGAFFGQRAYDNELEAYLEALLPASVRNSVKWITSAGGEDPDGAVETALATCRRLGLTGLKLGCVVNSDPLPAIRERDPVVLETGLPFSSLDGQVVGATVYAGAPAIVEALDCGADVVITGRVGDASLYLAPMVYEFGWGWNDWDLLARGIGIGHLMECGPQVTGGYFASPPHKIVPRLSELALPYAEVAPNGDAVITKLPNTGGLVSVATCSEQLLYEVGDPSNYVHNEVIVDWTTTTLAQDGPDRVEVSGTSGKPRPDTLKVLVTVREGYLAETCIMYAGSDALARAQLAAELIHDRLAVLGVTPTEFKASCIGFDSLLFGLWTETPVVPRELMLRVAGRFATREDAERFEWDAFITAGCHYGPAGGGGARRMPIQEIPSTYSVLIPRDAINLPEMAIFEVKGNRVHQS